MASGSFRFDRFVLIPGERQLRRDEEPVELSNRYLDALALLVSEEGRLVSKDRFMDQVWRGVPVTDEALTQCIRTLRRQLGDDAANPRFIETVPKHGYRFIAPVEAVSHGQKPRAEPVRSSWRQFLLRGIAGTIGGAVAGVVGGLFYGFAAASQPLGPGTGAVSVVLVLLSITTLVASIGAAGVSVGIAAADFASGGRWPWTIVGGAAGGLLVGAFVKLLGLDAFHLLFGRSPGDITGAAEGALLGGAIGLGASLADRLRGRMSLRRGAALASLAGGAAGLAIALLGGRMMGGSLDLLARSFPDSSLGLEQVGRLFGESGFGQLAQMVTGAIEGALFAGCIVAAMLVSDRIWSDARSPGGVG